MRLILLCLLFAPGMASAADVYPPANFTDPDRIAKIESAFPEIDKIFADYAAVKRIPGMVWGIVIDGQLRHVGSAGVQDLAGKTPVTASTVFRIASMTKSFTALAILQLRDQGKLSLEDPVSKWIPQFKRLELPTRDSAPLRIRQLLSHSAGFPEDNPWGDQQLAASDADLDGWLRQGIPFSTAPGTRYEYSNYAFGLLGRVVTKASGIPYDEYVRSRILEKLHMDSTTFRFSDVATVKRAVGYRLQPDGTYLEEAPLAQGVFGSAGGLLTNAEDLGRYIAFHLSAWPPRDEADDGPVRRSSVREMSHAWTPANLTVRRKDGVLQATESGYGYGLRVSADCRFEHIVAHGGGLPGFGSYMAWLPDYGVGIFAMATLTYSGPSEPINQVWDVMLRSGGLNRREVPASPLLTQMRSHVLSLWRHWDDAEAKQIAAMNLLIDAPASQRRADIQKLKDEVGECADAGPVLAENWLRGQFNLTCSKGTVGVFFTLSPTNPPAIQHLSFQKLESRSTKLGAPTGAPAGVACSD
ncbi:MAG: serine hydrolase domain-containing protein [Steroidobacteraceae bacterium]